MLDSISPIWGWLGLGGVGIAGLLAAAYLFPPTRKYALAAIGFIVGALVLYRRGYKDATGQWNKAIKRDVAKGRRARADAERDVASGRVRGDEWDRDKG